MRLFPQGSRAILNTDNLLYHLNEAREQLDELIDNIDRLAITDNDSSYLIPCSLSFRLLYHHVNLAWNTHQMPLNYMENVTKAEYKRLAGYPMSLGIACFPPLPSATKRASKKNKGGLLYRRTVFAKR